MRSLLVPEICLLLALAACAAPIDDAPSDPDVASIDPKADSFTTLDVGRLSVLNVACAFVAPCSVELQFEGDLVRPAVSGTEASVAWGTYEQVLAARDQLLTTEAPNFEPSGAQFAHGISVSDIAAGTASVTLGIPPGGAHVMLFGTTERWQGRVSVRVRLLLEPDRGMPLPVQEDGDYRASRPAPTADQVDTAGYAYDAWFVPIPDLFDFSTAPTVRVSRVGGSPHTFERIYYFCDYDDDGGPGPSTSVAPHVEESFLESSTTFRPDCPTWDESGRLYVEVAYNAFYSLSVVIE